MHPNKAGTLGQVRHGCVQGLLLLVGLGVTVLGPTALGTLLQPVSECLNPAHHE
jgi:hypothetical protein